MTTQRRMRLGLSMRYHGYHVAAWRHPDVPAAGTLDWRYFLRTAQTAERANFDMVFLADGVGARPATSRRARSASRRERGAGAADAAGRAGAR